MRSILDPTFDYTSSVATDIRKTFDRVWRELGEREDVERADADCDSLWLECNGDMMDAGAVQRIGVRKAARGVELVIFICPRCNEQHESLRFR